jgi:antitoxin VapB
VGNTLVLRRVAQETIGDLTYILAMFSPDFMADGREFHEQRDRDGSGPGEPGAASGTGVDKARG